MKKKVFRERYTIPKQDEIYSKEKLIKKVSDEALKTVLKVSKKKKSDK